MDARTARPIGEYSPRPFQGAQGLGWSIGWEGQQPANSGRCASGIHRVEAAIRDVR